MNDKKVKWQEEAARLLAGLIDIHRGWCNYCQGRESICNATAETSYECQIIPTQLAVAAALAKAEEEGAVIETSADGERWHILESFGNAKIITNEGYRYLRRHDDTSLADLIASGGLPEARERAMDEETEKWKKWFFDQRDLRRNTEDKVDELSVELVKLARTAKALCDVYRQYPDGDGWLAMQEFSAVEKLADEVIAKRKAKSDPA